MSLFIGILCWKSIAEVIGREKEKKMSTDYESDVVGINFWELPSDSRISTVDNWLGIFAKERGETE